tara:strand:+ start:222 stop:737 length:516 start_codon:yes stop_codon:yes gene_type:complete
MAFKMKGYSAGEGTGSSIAKKALVGAQNNLPEDLKASIEAAPGKMYDKTMAKQKKKIKNKGKMEGPIPEQNLPLQPGENDGTWIYGRGYEGEDPKEGIKEMKTDEKTTGKKFVKSERMIDYDDRAGNLEQNDLMDLEGDNSPKAIKKRKQLKKTIKTLDREAQIMRDRTNK